MCDVARSQHKTRPPCVVGLSTDPRGCATGPFPNARTVYATCYATSVCSNCQPPRFLIASGAPQTGLSVAPERYPKVRMASTNAAWHEYK